MRVKRGWSVVVPGLARYSDPVRGSNPRILEAPTVAAARGTFEQRTSDVSSKPLVAGSPPGAVTSRTFRGISTSRSHAARRVDLGRLWLAR